MLPHTLQKPLPPQRSQTPLMQMITLHPEQHIRHRKQRQRHKQVNPMPSHKRKLHNPQDSYQRQCRPTTSKILVNENVRNSLIFTQIPKVARILYNPTDYTKIRATSSSISYIPFTISTKFSITYSASSIDILVFRGSVISFSNR